MSFRFKQATCVAVGTFNVYIFQPNWIGRLEGLPEGAEVTVESDLSQPGMRLSSPRLTAKWTVRPERVVISADSPSVDCGTPMSRVLRKLPETPLRAVGCNYEFLAPASEMGKVSAPTLPVPELPDGLAVKQRTWHYGVGDDAHLFNLQLSLTAESMELAINVHANVKSAEVGAAFASRFVDLRSQAEVLLKKVFAIEVEYADDVE